MTNKPLYDENPRYYWVAANDSSLPEDPQDMSLFKTLAEAERKMPKQRYFKVAVARVWVPE